MNKLTGEEYTMQEIFQENVKYFKWNYKTAQEIIDEVME